VPADLHKDAVRAAIATWQSTSNLRVPSILAAGTFASLPGLNFGFPSALFLEPWSEMLRVLANDLVTDFSDTFQVSDTLMDCVLNERISFLRDNTEYVMCMSTSATQGHHSWCMPAHDGLQNLFLELPRELKDQLLQKEMEPDEEPIPQGLLFSPCANLLGSFQPRKWAALLQATYSTPNNIIRGQNVLWMQVIILEIAIRLLVCGSFDGMTAVSSGGNIPQWGPQELAIVVAIAKSWGPHLLSRRPREESDSDEEYERGNRERECERDHETDGEIGHGSDPGGQNENGGRKESLKKEPSLESSLPPTRSDDERPSVFHLPVEIDWAGTSKDKSKPRKVNLLRTESKLVADAEMLSWDLEGALREFTDLEHRLPLPEIRIRRLAALLKMRAFFYIAYFMVQPDSSDVFLAQGSTVEMPIM
jgi:hypothetical protein